MPDLRKLDSILEELKPFDATLVAVSKTKPVTEIEEVFNHGHLHFGENYVQEMVAKQPLLSSDVKWHFIGHLQSNKVKQIAPFVHLIHGVDSLNVVKEANKQGQLNNRTLDLLIQVHVAAEETKFGLTPNEVQKFLEEVNTLSLPFVSIRGLMGMATFTDDVDMVRREFRTLKKLFDSLKIQMNTSGNEKFTELSMGMSNDYKIALKEGSTMVRIGSAIFGER